MFRDLQLTTTLFLVLSVHRLSLLHCYTLVSFAAPLLPANYAIPLQLRVLQGSIHYVVFIVFYLLLIPCVYLLSSCMLM